jgi:hypothetical protein
MTSAPPSSSSGLDLVDLRFAYGGSASNGPLLLDGFNLTLPPGARCLLVGANGAGEFFPPLHFLTFFFSSFPIERDARGPLTAFERLQNEKKNTQEKPRCCRSSPATTWSLAPQ